MRRLFLPVFSAVLAFAPVAWGQDSRLTTLATGDDSRGWEAVGRLNVAGKGFCTGALIAPNLVLTAAHCLFDKATGARIDQSEIEFLAGWRNGRASAYRWVKRSVIHPDYNYGGPKDAARVRNDVALLELHHPIRNGSIHPFKTQESTHSGQRIGVVSYAHDRSEAPSLQHLCDVMARQNGLLITSCDVDFGSSGAPMFSFDGEAPQIVSVVSAKAEVGGKKVSLGTDLSGPLARLMAEYEAGGGEFTRAAPEMSRAGLRRDTGAKFAKP